MSERGRCEVCGRPMPTDEEYQATFGPHFPKVEPGMCWYRRGEECVDACIDRRVKLEALADAVGAWDEHSYPENVRAALRALVEGAG